ncbi:MAG TPA: thiolase family protein [Ignavibacteria bacterium]|nr:thiolase family protein [Ignavibacteria bacterium]
MKDVFIISAVRTPIGSYLGSLSGFKATELGSIVIKETLRKAGIAAGKVSEVIMGCVLPAGLGQAPARQASIGAGIPVSVPCTTVNKVCGSGLKSVMLAAQAIKSGDADIVVAGGFESMSNVPYYLDKARSGYRMGNAKIIDGMINDGLWDPYNNFHMGNAAEICAQRYNISRKEQDDFSIRSYENAISSTRNGLYTEEIVPVIVTTKNSTETISEDEEISRYNPEKGTKLKPAFDKSGSVTVFNASKINDGASALVLASGEKVKELGLIPIAKVLAQFTFAQDPEWFTTAPAFAIQGICKKAGINVSDVDLFEINEAFAVQALSVIKIAGLDINKVNVKGGAVALGHPIGASGSRILTTLLHTMKERKAKTGLATLCLGGGEASALLVENI